MKKALLIGINYLLLEDKKLKGCINDIIDMRNVLIDAYNYDINNIIMLRDDSENDIYQPTRMNIITHLNNLINETSNLSEIWIHYSGHGSNIINKNDKNENNSEKKDQLMVPVDYLKNGFIKDDELLDIIKNSKCRTMIIADCCHSGTIFDLPFSFQYNDEENIMKEIKNSNIELENKNIFMYSACNDEETTPDFYNNDENKYSGVFTVAFINCLRKNKHNVTIVKLYEDIFSFINEKGFHQIPLLSYSYMNSSIKIQRDIIE